MEDPSPSLPREIMESQLSMIDLLTAMFPESHELTINPETHKLMEQLRNWCNNEDQEKPLLWTIPPNLSITLHLSIESESTNSNSIQLNISVPLRSDELDILEAPPMKVVVRQPDWMSRAEVAELSACMPTADVFSAIEYIRDEAPKYIKSSLQQIPTSTASNGNLEPLSRVWFYFPSLSTREKRDDLVNHAPRYNLTGFVLAGKPGVLCLEGVSGDVDAYMKFIKTESWGDIPSYQKKVSERYREEGGGIVRVFEGMVEITSSLGDRGGARGNRGDMQAWEAWLVERGLGDAFKRVVM